MTVEKVGQLRLLRERQITCFFGNLGLDHVQELNLGKGNKPEEVIQSIEWVSSHQSRVQEFSIIQWQQRRALYKTRTRPFARWDRCTMRLEADLWLMLDGGVKAG